MNRAAALRMLAAQRDLVLQGRADVSITLAAWAPATLYRSRAVIEFDARLLGVPLHAKVVLERLTPANFGRVAHSCVGMPALDRPTGDDWRRLEPARVATSIVTTRRDVMLALAEHWVVASTLNDVCGPQIVGAVLETLKVPTDDYEIWEPILLDAPPQTVALWRSFRSEGLWQEQVGQVIDACTTISTSGPLAVLVEEHLGLEFVREG
jgi:hypothetical protein